MAPNSTDYHRKYIAQHNISMDCECGGRYKRFAFSTHTKTHKHQTSLQKKEEEKKEERKEKKQVIRTVFEGMFKKIQELEAKVKSMETK